MKPGGEGEEHFVAVQLEAGREEAAADACDLAEREAVDAALFLELESFGVRHGDPFPRNITYSPHLGRFCVIDFEFATLLDSGEGLTIEDLERMAREK